MKREIKAGFNCSQSREDDGKSRGFHMTFSNGNTVSVQWHYGSYINDRDNDGFSDVAELAIWDKEGNWDTRRVFKELFSEDLGDDVAGYTTTEQVAQVLAYCAK